MALNKPVTIDKLHYSGPSGGSNYHSHGSGAGGYSGHVYSSIGHSGYGGYGNGGSHESHHSKGGGKKSVALSALTLLAFLFFLHILQTCLQDQTTDTTTSTNFVVMDGRKENRQTQDTMKKRKGDMEIINREYDDNDYTEKKSSVTNWEEMGKEVVTTRVKTFSKYDQPEHI